MYAVTRRHGGRDAVNQCTVPCQWYYCPVFMMLPKNFFSWTQLQGLETTQFVQYFDLLLICKRAELYSAACQPAVSRLQHYTQVPSITQSKPSCDEASCGLNKCVNFTDQHQNGAIEVSNCPSTKLSFVSEIKRKPRWGITLHFIFPFLSPCLKYNRYVYISKKLFDIVYQGDN